MISIVDKILNRFGYKVTKVIGSVSFSLYQSYDGPGSTEMIRCPECRGGEFFVGQGSYFTVSKCIECGHEECIHNG